MKLRKGDPVRVITGKDKGKEGVVEHVYPKANKVIVKLGKKKSEYGSYDFWSDLTAKGGKQAKKEKSADPGKGIMDLMKQMYDDGDDNMKKMIGETMLKQREGKLGDGIGDAGGMGGMENMGGMSL